MLPVSDYCTTDYLHMCVGQSAAAFIAKGRGLAVSASGTDLPPDSYLSPHLERRGSSLIGQARADGDHDSWPTESEAFFA